MGGNSKRTISAVLAAALFWQAQTQSLYANDEWFAVGSSANKWADGSGGRYFYGGDITFKFKRNTSFKPLIESEAPGLKAGCNGVSLKGGFLHMLGLDEIKEQLSSATQGALMGVVVGLVYSMPSLAHAFDTVQKYVRMFQQLLGQSCQMASRMTQEFIKAKTAEAKGSPSGQAFWDNPIGNSFQFLNNDVAGFIDAPNKGIESFVTQLNKNPNNKEISKQITAASANEQCKGVCAVVASKCEREIKASIEPDFAVADKRLKDLAAIMTSEQEAYRSAMFAIVFMGYHAVDSAPVKINKDMVGGIVAGATSTSGYIKSQKSTYQRGLYFSSSEGLSGSTVVKTLLYGPGGGSATIPVANIHIYPYYSENNESGKITSKTYGVLFGKAEHAGGATSTFAYPWSGLIRGGEDHLRRVVFDGDYTGVSEVPSVIPGMNRYVQTLRTIYRKSKDQAYVGSLISLLAKKNAVMLLQSMVYELQTTLSQSESVEYKSQIDAIYAELDRLNKSDAGIVDIVNLFEGLDEQQRRDATTGYKNK